jgi:hypothetical protein
MTRPCHRGSGGRSILGNARSSRRSRDRPPAVDREHSVLARPRRGRGGGDHGRLGLGRVRVARRRLRGPDVRDHRGLPPLLRTPRVQDQSRVPVHPRAARRSMSSAAARSAVVGHASSPTTTSSATNPRTCTRRGSAASGTRTRVWLLVEPPLGSPTSSKVKDFAEVPGAALASINNDLLIADRLGRRARTRIGGSHALVWGLLRARGRPHVAPDVHDQLARARLGRAPLRRPRMTRRNNAAPGAADARRGLAQQPPPLPALGAPGLLLVGGRSQSFYVLKVLEVLPHRLGRAGRAAPRPRSDRGARARPPGRRRRGRRGHQRRGVIAGRRRRRRARPGRSGRSFGQA